MFDFLTQFFSGRDHAKSINSSPKTVKKTPSPAGDVGQPSEPIQKQAQLEQQRQIWKQKLDAAANNESLVIDMLMACDFADGRWYAAQHVHSQLGLEKIRDAFKKSDKRVTKLAISRLEQIQQQEKNTKAVQACIEQARHLLSLDYVLPNHLIQLDAQKEVIVSFPVQSLQQFQQLRTQLEHRMTEQVQLQRRLLDLISRAEAEIDNDLTQANMAFVDLQQELNFCLAHRLAGSLPKHLVQEAHHSFEHYQDKLTNLSPKIAYATEIMAAIEQQSNEVLAVAAEGPISQVQKAQEQTELDTKIQDVKPMSESQSAAMPDSLSASQLNEALDGLERALQDGIFQQAKAFEKRLREVDLTAAPKYLDRQQKERLLQARKQFKHLLSWAKWSGDASREELVNTAEGLANLKLDPKEIVDTVTALRAQWKQMEATSGGAPKELWLRFDSACSTAYAPAGAYFQQQAETRKNNVLKAEQKLIEMRLGVDALLNTERNWKAIGATILHMQQEWKRIGPVERKEKTRLDQQFAELLQRLTSIFEVAQTQAIQFRRELIQQIKALDQSAKNTIDQVRAAQAQWQSSANQIILERKLEQQLWLEFRSACDAVFEARKQSAFEADQERQKNQQSKLALCEKLERFSTTDIAALHQFRQEIQTAWQNIGAVPRHEEMVLLRRYEQGMESLQELLKQLQVQAKRARIDGILNILKLTHQAEVIASEHLLESVEWAALAKEWAVLEIPKNKAGRSLKQRWEQLVQLCAANDVASNTQRTLSGNALEVDHIILSLEILLQLESPERLQQERRQIQLEILQKSMKQGRDGEQVSAMLQRLLSLPVAFSLERQIRIKTIVEQAADLLLVP